MRAVRVVTVLALGGACATGGVQYERWRAAQQLPPSRLSVCCDAAEATAPARSSPSALQATMAGLVGADNVRLQQQRGSRVGQGLGLVVEPRTLAEAVQVVQAAVDAGAVVLPQGANTGLTGGSVPRNAATDRPWVVVSLRRHLNRVVPLEGGRQVLAFGGAGIADVAKVAAYVGREGHSHLGSFFLNPTVGAGVALGSGGTTLRKGPVYTERALFVRVDGSGRAEVVDTLGLVARDGRPLLEWLQEGGEPLRMVDNTRHTHDIDYAQRVCQLDSSAVSRHNADTRGCDALRSEGKVLVLASIHSTFPKPRRSQMAWIACDSIATAHRVRAACLHSPGDLPTTLEYMDRDAVDVVQRAGRGLCWAIQHLGIGERLLRLWNWKLRVEASPVPFADRAIDALLFWTNSVFPAPLPATVHAASMARDHHVLVELGDFGDGGFQRLRQRLEELQADLGDAALQLLWLSPPEAARVKTFRFAAAPAFRTYCVGRRLQGLCLDYALPLNYTAVPVLGNTAAPAIRMRYCHFGCAVVHEDIGYAAHVPLAVAKDAAKAAVEALGGALPAEHGHGCEYVAPPAFRERLRALDPGNVMNPGVAGDSAQPRYRD